MLFHTLFPARGRKLSHHLSPLGLARCFVCFTPSSPQGDGNFQMFNVQRDVVKCFTPSSPQGDGNNVTCGHESLLREMFHTLFPARGRKLCSSSETFPVHKPFHILFPARGRKPTADKARRADLLECFTPSSPQGDGN